MNTRRSPSGFGNPVLIGALTVLVVIVAVFLAYNANNGLPFVPSYTLNVQVTDASELTHGADVHMGGALVGFVDSVHAERLPSGRPIAVLGLKLNKSFGRLPVDSTFAIRLKGTIGQKYLAINLGRSKHTFPDGATVLLRQTGAAVDLDQVLSMFSPPTRQGVVASTVGFSDGLAGRGGGRLEDRSAHRRGPRADSGCVGGHAGVAESGRTARNGTDRVARAVADEQLVPNVVSEAVEPVGRVRAVEQNGHQLVDRAGLFETRGQLVELGGGRDGLRAELVELLGERERRDQRRLGCLGGGAEVGQ